MDFLHSVALCGQGAVKDLSFISLGMLPGDASALSPLSLRGGAASRLASDATETAVRRMLGISKEAWNRHGRP